MKRSLFLLIICSFVFSGVFAQKIPVQQDIQQIAGNINAWNDSLAIEKLYIQTDKPRYTAGDTLWFKAYLFKASQLTYSDKSGLLYIEIRSDSTDYSKRLMVPVFNGIAYGSIPLSEDLPRGNYILRGYTSWLLNFGENYQFKKELYIDNGPETEWLVGYNTKIIRESGKDKVNLGVKVTQFDKAPVGLREMQVGITNGKKTWLKSKTETSLEGILNLSFDVPDKILPKELTLTMQDLRKSQDLRTVTVPIALNRPEYIDLQFMPEGGGLVAGQVSKVAFKALNEDGLSAHVKGKIVNSKEEQVAAFESSHKGMGIFSLLPQANESYSARLELPEGGYKTYPFPAVSKTGITFSILNPFDRDSCELILSPSDDLKVGGKEYYLMGMSDNMVFWAGAVNFKKGELRTKLSKAMFPDGIVRFLFLDQNMRTLGERMIYNNVQGNLNIQVETSKASYEQRDSILLNIKVTDKKGNPISGTFSLAVTDDMQVKKDNRDANIMSHVFLSSALKGHVEDPGYYYSASMDEERWKNIDYLLLSQGWSGYDWQEALKPAKPFAYASEREFLVKGKATNVFNKPLSNASITLWSKKPVMFMDTLTNDKGEFTFKGMYPVDTAIYFLSSKNKNGKKFNIGLDVYEFTPPDFAGPRIRSRPWFANMDSIAYTVASKQQALQKTYLTATGRNMLKEVKITAKKVVPNSKNLNGPGGADFIMNQEDIAKAMAKKSKITLRDLLKQVPGFNETLTDSNTPLYRIKNEYLRVIVDGIDTEFMKPGDLDYGQYLRDVFDYYDASDIKGIEVITKGQYLMIYGSKFLNLWNQRAWDFAFIEVTTRSGKGPLLLKVAGNYIYRPIPFTIPKKFYAPKYLPESIADMSDIRSTIHWEPNIFTNKEGQASVKFFAADNPGTYTYVIEGANLRGALGTGTNQLIIKNQSMPVK